MKNVMTPLTLVLLTACFEPASQDEPRSTVTDPVSTEASIPADPGTSEEPELVIGELQAQGVQASSDERMEDALHLTNAMMEVLLWDEVNDYAEDHELDGNGALAPTMDSCVTVTLHIGYLDIDFDQCGQLDGTVILQTGLFTTVTTVIFEDDFSFRDIDIDGEFTAEYNLFTHGFELRDAEITLDDEVTFAAELEVGVFGTPSLWGTFDVTKGGTTITVVTGTETSPLTWDVGCVCPATGYVETSVATTVDTVIVDLDTLVNPKDGTNDYPWLAVPTLSPVNLDVSLGVDYAGCADSEVTVSGHDAIEVWVDNHDIESSLNAACADARIDKADCTVAQGVLATLDDEILLPTDAELVGDAIEEAFQDAVDAICVE